MQYNGPTYVGNPTDISSLMSGTIVLPIPEAGAAIVDLLPHPPGTSRYIIGYYPHLDCGIGASPVSMYPAGATVLCSRCYSNSDAFCWIVGVVSGAASPCKLNIMQSLTYNRGMYLAATGKLLSSFNLLTQLSGSKDRTKLITCHFDGFSGDALPGDYDIRDMEGTAGLHIGRSIAQLHGSALAYIDACELDDKVRVVALEYERHSLTHTVIDRPYLYLSAQAINYREASGLNQQNPDNKFAANEGKFRLDDKYPDSVPLFRNVTLSGRSVFGVETSVMMGDPRLDPIIYTKKDDPIVLYKDRVGIDGTKTTASAKSITSFKTPDIIALNPNGAIDSKNAIDIKPPSVLDEDIEPPADETEEQREQRLTCSSIARLMKKLISGGYKKTMIESFKKEGLTLAAVDGGLSAVFGSSTNNILSMQKCSNESMYPIPQSLALTDPVTQTTQEYSDLTSMITQEEDGSICLRDGYGSEIRMSRGNIYISPAQDLVLTPGRDLLGMVPGNQAFNTKGSTYIDSAQSVAIKADRDLLMCGANGGYGKVTMESRTKSADQGIMLHSTQGLACTAEGDITIARAKITAEAQDNIKGYQNPSRGGTIAIDGGRNGVIYNNAISIVNNASEWGVVADHDNDLRAAVIFNNNAFSVCAPNLRLAGTTIIGASGMDVTANVVNENGLETKKVSLPEKMQLMVDGDILTTGGVFADGYVQSDRGIMTAAVYALDDIIRHISNKDKDGNISKIWEPFDFTFPQEIELGRMLLAATDKSLVYTPTFLTNAEFNLMFSDDGPDYKLIDMIWQYQDRETSVVDMGWVQRPATNSAGVMSWSYPGKSLWDRGRIVSVDGMLEFKNCVVNRASASHVHKGIPNLK